MGAPSLVPGFDPSQDLVKWALLPSAGDGKKLWEAQGILILSCSSLTLTLPKNKNKKNKPQNTPKIPKNTKNPPQKYQKIPTEGAWTSVGCQSSSWNPGNFSVALEKIPAPASAPAVGEERENPPGFWCFPSAAHPGTATPDCSAKLERLQEQRSGILGCFSPGKMVKVIKTEPSFGHSLKLENQIKIQNR